MAHDLNASLPIAAFELELQPVAGASLRASNAGDAAPPGAALSQGEDSTKAAILPQFDFTSLDASSAMGFAHLVFADDRLESDFVRYNTAGRGAIIPAVFVCVSCALGLLVSLLSQPEKVPAAWAQPATTVAFAAGAALSAVTVLCGYWDMSPAVLEVLLVASAALTHAANGTYCATQFAQECIDSFVDHGHTHADAVAHCAAVPSVLVLVAQYVLCVGIRMRLRCGGPAVVFSWSVYTVVSFVVWHHVPARTQAPAAVVSLTATVGVIALCVVNESAHRAAFLRLFHAAIAHRRVDDHKDTMLSLGRVALPQYLHPRVGEALTLSDLSAPVRSRRASVCVLSVADNIIGCRAVPPGALVAALTKVVAVLDETVGFFGIHKLTTYGDYYVTEAGLTTDHEEGHADVMTDFGNWVTRKLSSIGATCVPLLTVRSAVATGQLSCSVVGEGAKRFIVVGSALTAAMHALTTTTARFVSVEAEGATNSTTDTSGGVSLHQFDEPDATGTALSADVLTLSRSAAVPTLPPTAQQRLTRVKRAIAAHFNDFTCIGTFASPIVCEGFETFCVADERRFGFIASITLIVVIGAGVVGATVERLLIGGTSSRTVGAFLAIFAFYAGLVGRTVHLRLVGVLPRTHDAILLLFIGAAGNVSVAFSTETAVVRNPQVPMLIFTLFIAFMNRRLHWTTVSVIIGINGVLTAVLAIVLDRHPTETVLRRSSAVLFVQCCTWFLYKDLQRRYAVAAAAAAVSSLAVENVRTQRALLDKLMPPALVDSTVGFLAKAARGEATWHCFEDHEMLVFEASVRRIARPDDGPPVVIAAATTTAAGGAPEPTLHYEDDLTFWQGCAALVDATCATLLVVQIVGDRFMVAGPFKRPTTRDLNVAVREFIALARALVAHAADCSMRLIGAAHIDLAYAGVVGTSSSVFRVLGPACRQVHELLAGVPVTEQSAVFASSAVHSFSEHCCAAHGHDEDAEFYSVTPTPSVLGKAPDAAAADVSAAPTSAAPSMLSCSDDFSAPMRWRVRGGPVIVHAVVLTDVTRGAHVYVAGDSTRRSDDGGDDVNPLQPVAAQP